MPDLNDLQKLDLEATIDKHGIDGVLEALADICREKAVHITENWQDAPLSSRWEEIATALGMVARKAEGL